MFHKFPRYQSVRFVIIVLALVCLASWATFVTYSHSARGTGLVLPLTSPMVVPPPAMTFTVNSLADTNDGACDMTDCTLREAINAANSNPGLDTISFNIPGGGVQTILPNSPLPLITDPVIIDGYTQPGATRNTLASGNNAAIMIEIKRSPIGFGAGLQLSSGSDGSTIQGLSINNFSGTQISVFGSSGNTISGNYIGTNPSGTAAVMSGGAGVHIFSARNVIGGTSPADANLISGNGLQVFKIGGNPTVVATGGPGIFLDGGFNQFNNTCNPLPQVTGNIIEGNLIGTDHTGTFAIPNATGVFIACNATGNVVGGTTPTKRNVISGNKISPPFDSGRFGQGVLIALGADDNLVQGNYIGTDSTGTVAVPNESFGVSIGFHVTGSGAPNNVIGGIVPGSGNVISGNVSTGVLIQQGSTGNKVQQNLIGTDASGTAALGNGGSGVTITSSSNNIIGFTTDGLIGGPSAGNVIAYSGFRGVSVNSDSGNLISQNSIFDNGALGIDLGGGNGVTPNDPCDTDTGANNLQNFPVLTSVSSSGGSTTIQGTLNSTASTTFTLEFFANAVADPTGFGEGQTFIGSTMVTTDGNCNASFTFTGSAPSGQQVITATATDPGGNTSEFSHWLQLTSTAVQSTPDPSTFGQSVTFTATVTSGTNPVTEGSVTFKEGPTVLSGPTTVDANGQASFSTSILSVGSHTITAEYSGTANFSASSGQVTQTVVFPPSTEDVKVTGGGSIQLTTGGSGTFGLVGMVSSADVPSGNVEYQDHDTGMNVKATTITSVVVSGTHAQMFGKATINGSGSFDFVVDVDDIAEPGINVDAFRIQLSNGYTAGPSKLSGGNIQVHK